jgi:predicted nucleotidyltransferase component of viral defense system
MKLHQNIKLFSDTLRAASQHLGIKLVFVEKDYWITLVLSRLAASNYVDETVFKGGTSLSKGHILIERFSEDVDLAIINNGSKSGNEIKTIIRKVEKAITADLEEVPTEGTTSKGSRFRKSVFEYDTIEKGNTGNKLIVEINSFANPFPYQKLWIKSMVSDFLAQTENEKYIIENNLQPFEVNVLSKEQTLLEKLASLIRFSFDEDPIASISGKIRHFYDLYFLMNHPACSAFVASDQFRIQLDNLLQHDKSMFDEPSGWQSKSIGESPLITDFESIWKAIKGQYKTELSALAYQTNIPDEAGIESVFIGLRNKLSEKS